MIVMRLRGRLGNQLFIYAFGRALQEKYHQPLVLMDNTNDTQSTPLSALCLSENVSIVPYSTGYDYKYTQMKAADYANITNGLRQAWEREAAFKTACKSNHIALINSAQKAAYIRYKLYTRRKSRRACYEYETKNSKQLVQKGLFLCENGYLEFPQTSSEHLFAMGYFQSERYFSELTDKIRAEVTPPCSFQDDAEINLLRQIQTTNSVCLSIRMGDYLENPIMGVCTPAYYQQAIDEMYTCFPDASFFVFSDDVEGVKKKIVFRNEVIYEPHGYDEWQKLKFMSACKHFILSNSSFSWWAQYLGSAPNKTVIAPKKWYAIDIPCDIYQPDWICLKV